MKIKQCLKSKKIVISIICILALLIGVIIYIFNNTTWFRNKEDIKGDLESIKEYINNNEDAKNVENAAYSNDVGVSNGIPYIKENASDKVKQSAEGIMGQEKTVVTQNGMAIIEPYEDSSVIEYKIISNTKNELKIVIYDYENLCSVTYALGSITDKSQIERGEDSLFPNIVAPSTEYTLTSSITGVNTVFFFDENMKFISSTTENTFTTPANARYIKIMTEAEDEQELLQNIEEDEEGGKVIKVRYNLVLGKEPSDMFIYNDTRLDTTMESEHSHYIPFPSTKSVIYVDGAEIELKYID